VEQKSCWHPCLLPDNYQRKLRQDLAEASVDSGSRIVPDEEEGQDDEASIRPLDDGRPHDACKEA
jgi:hypothetical protein